MAAPEGERYPESRREAGSASWTTAPVETVGTGLPEGQERSRRIPPRRPGAAVESARHRILEGTSTALLPPCRSGPRAATFEASVSLSPASCAGSGDGRTLDRCLWRPVDRSGRFRWVPERRLRARVGRQDRRPRVLTTDRGSDISVGATISGAAGRQQAAQDLQCAGRRGSWHADLRCDAERTACRLTNRAVALDVLDGAAPNSPPLQGRAFPVEGCTTIAWAQRKRRSRPRTHLRCAPIEAVGSKFQLFIEYPPAFGEQAWETTCP